MILLLGTDQDCVTAYFRDFLEEKKIQYVFLNQSLLFNKRIQMFSEYLILDKVKYFYTDFFGTLNRMSSIDYATASRNTMKDASKINAMLSYIMMYKLKNVLNLNCYSLSNESKLMQLSMIKEVVKYIKLPDSIVIKNLDIARYLYENSSHNKHIVKSLSSVRSIVKEYECNIGTIFCGDKTYEPVLFQQLLKGINIRVHVIDGDIFPIKIYSDSLDYRYNNNIRKFEQTVVPREIKQDCINISKHLKLRFAGIDLLLLEQTGEYYTFEVNPSPGYAYYEQEINSKHMSEKLVRVLQNA